jgi:hypothetical protein
MNNSITKIFLFLGGNSMKNTKKVLLSVLCVAFCAVILACASGGGGGKTTDTGPAELYGNWKLEANDDSNDKGTSKITMTVADEVIDGKTVKTYTFKGVVTNAIQYGVVDATLTPDADTLAYLKTAKGISFKMKADGRDYIVEAPTSDVKDWGFHRYKIKTNPGEEMLQDIQIRMFLQPAWATAVRFYQTHLSSIRIQTVNAAEGGTGPFEFKIWDIRLYK